MLIIGIPGTTLDDTTRAWLAEPVVSGVILFTRNFVSREQVTALIESIRELRPESFLVCVDQEGGPVQRFRAGFTRLPALARIGALYETEPARAIALAEEHAWLMASEMRAIGVDLSFAPVVDLARGNRAIGERAFHAEPETVSTLTLAYLRGMRLAGMAATLKHFPGHGSVVADTHFDSASDPRSLAELRTSDLIPFADGVGAGAEAVMVAHVAYPEIDAQPAGFSPVWIEDVLRGDLKFAGTVIGDDIAMAAAEAAGGIGARVAAHRAAGCDIILACNPAIVPETLEASRDYAPCPVERIAPLIGNVAPTWQQLIDNPQHAQFAERVTALDAEQGEPATTEARPT